MTGTRTIEVALAEIQIIKHNVYVQRKERSLPEVRVTAENFELIVRCWASMESIDRLHFVLAWGLYLARYWTIGRTRFPFALVIHHGMSMRWGVLTTV